MPTINSFGAGSILDTVFTSQRGNLSSSPSEQEDSRQNPNALQFNSQQSPASVASIQSHSRDGSPPTGATSQADTYQHLSKGSLSEEKLAGLDKRQSLKQLQGLMENNKSYAIEARREIITQTETRKTEAGTSHSIKEIGEYNDPQDMSFSITTKDGDHIQIQITDSREYDEDGSSYDTRAISFEIDGDLDAGELQALAELSDKVAGMSDDFSAQEWTDLGNFDAFDETELKHFSLDITGSGATEFSIDYAVDETLGIRTLNANQNGYEFDLSVDLDGLMLDSSIANNAQYQQYRHLIQDTSLAYESGTEDPLKVSRFFQQGLDLLFRVDQQDDKESAEDIDNNVKQAPDSAQAAIDKHIANNANNLEKFSSGLADFSASFSSPRVVTDQGEVLEMKLDFSQTTSIEAVGEHGYSYRQDSEFSSVVSQINTFKPWQESSPTETSESNPTDSPGDNTEKSPGLYTYTSEKKNESISRALNFSNANDIASIEEIRNSNRELKEEIVKPEKDINGEAYTTIVDKHTERDSDHSELSFNVANTTGELRLAQQQLSNYRTIEQLEAALNGSKINLFS